MQQSIFNPIQGEVGTPLRSRTVVEVLDRAFNIFRDNIVSFVGVSAAVAVPIAILQFALIELVFDPTPRFSTVRDDDYLGLFLEVIDEVFVLSVLLTILQQTLIFGLVSVMTSEAHLGRRATIATALQQGLWRLPLLFIVLAFVYLAVGVALLGVAALGVFGILFMMGIPAYVAMCGLAYSTPAVMLEPSGNPLRALVRAWALTRGRFWPVFWTVVFLFVMFAVVQVIVVVGELFVLGGTVASVDDDLYFLLVTLVNAVVSALLLPAVPAVLTVSYYDARVRLEGLDLALQLNNLPQDNPQVLTPPAPRVPITGRDFGLMAILSVTMIGLLMVAGVVSFFTLRV